MNTTKTITDIANTLAELGLGYTWNQGDGNTGVLKVSSKDIEASVVVMTGNCGKITHHYDGGYGKDRFSTNGFWASVNTMTRN